MNMTSGPSGDSTISSASVRHGIVRPGAIAAFTYSTGPDPGTQPEPLTRSPSESPW
jgi:hypothetical protein